MTVCEQSPARREARRTLKWCMTGWCTWREGFFADGSELHAACRNRATTSERRAVEHPGAAAPSPLSWCWRARL